MSQALLAALALVPFTQVTGAPLFDHHEVTFTVNGVAGEVIKTTDDSIDLDLSTINDGSVVVASGVSIDTAGNPIAPAVVSDPFTTPVGSGLPVGGTPPPPPPPQTAQVIGSITLSLVPPAAPPATGS